ncbi:MAG: alpha-glucan family phosphorylase, partial [Candidatus Jacksonbacteria bacterium]|nr:alpha-glucan family phosphorylase [Candidatus Jacksonbacteria bacterium]
VTLLYKKGYFLQSIDKDGNQIEEAVSWNPEDYLKLLPQKVTVTIENREVTVQAWVYALQGVTGHVNSVIFLDTDVSENSHPDRAITHYLYGGDERYRFAQEIVLGIGGVRMLETLSCTHIHKYHMNEGHSALLTLELYKKFEQHPYPLAHVRRRCVFTTHTPVASGHDQFGSGLVWEMMGDAIPDKIKNEVFTDNVLNMTRLGLQMSKYFNGVAKKHGEISRLMFPGYQIESITNGMHAWFWASASFRKLFDKYLPGWAADPYSLRYVLSIPGQELWKAHFEAKRDLISYINKSYHAKMDAEVFTIGFARRATAYKRGVMLFSDTEWLKQIARKSRGIQIIYAGNAHPKDYEGKALIREVIERMRDVQGEIRVCYIENYNIDVAKFLVSGVDLWLNTPIRPQEASGTSGMKAALNGIPHFSVLDGWWLEGHIENVTGWSIGPHPDKLEGDVDKEDFEDMYNKLEYIILPIFYNQRDEWIRIMRHAIAINGSFFNTHRMVQQYVLNAYFK